MIADNNLKLKIRLIDLLNPAEIYIIFLAALYCLLLVIFHSHFPNFIILLNYNVGIIGIILASAFMDYYFDHAQPTRIFRLIVISVLVYMSYLNTQNYVKVLNPHDYDAVLIAWDNSLFGGNPDRFFEVFRNKFLTEVLQICYVLFYLLPIIHGAELFIRRKELQLNDLTNNIVFAFILSFIFYFCMPAIGPRFTIFDFRAMDNEIPGLCLTHALREFINGGGGIPPEGMSHPELYVNRDCMPSGHTWITLVNLVLAFKYRSKLRYFICVVGVGLIIATMYLRYHYCVDIIAGIILAIVSLYLEPVVTNWLNSHKNHSEIKSTAKH